MALVSMHACYVQVASFLHLSGLSLLSQLLKSCLRLDVTLLLNRLQ